MSHEITSLNNPRLKAAVKLRDRAGRIEQHRIIIDGAREIARAMDAGVRVLELFTEQRLSDPAERELAARVEQSNGLVWKSSPEVLAKVAYGERSRGVVAIAEPPALQLSSLRLPADATVAVLVGLEKPGNVGAVVRSSDAAGVVAAIVCDGGTDLYNPNAIRASVGTIFTLPVVAANTRETLAWLRANSMKIYAARVDGAVDYTKADLRGPTAIVLGCEAEGLPAAWRADDIFAVKLPMRGAADSLNVSVTAAVLFYEALRQREQR